MSVFGRCKYTIDRLVSFSPFLKALWVSSLIVEGPALMVKPVLPLFRLPESSPLIYMPLFAKPPSPVNAIPRARPSSRYLFLKQPARRQVNFEP